MVDIDAVLSDILRAELREPLGEMEARSLAEVVHDQLELNGLVIVDVRRDAEDVFEPYS
jgi:hypothetical protein